MHSFAKLTRKWDIYHTEDSPQLSYKKENRHAKAVIMGHLEAS